MTQAAQDKAADDGCDGVHIHVQHDGHAPRHHISQHTAADRGDKPQHGRQKKTIRVGILIKCRQRSRHGEGRKTHRIRDIVHERDVALILLRYAIDRVEKRNDECRDDGNEEPVGAAKYRRRRDAAEDVTHHPAAYAGHDSKHGDAENIHTPRQSHHRTGKGKGDGAERFKNEPGDGHGRSFEKMEKGFRGNTRQYVGYS